MAWNQSEAPGYNRDGDRELKLDADFERNSEGHYEVDDGTVCREVGECRLNPKVLYDKPAHRDRRDPRLLTDDFAVRAPKVVSDDMGVVRAELMMDDPYLYYLERKSDEGHRGHETYVLKVQYPEELEDPEIQQETGLEPPAHEAREAEEVLRSHCRDDERVEGVV